MTIRTEGDIILASNLSQDLVNLVVAYLELYKKHAQGINDVYVPEKYFTVNFLPMKREGCVSVMVVYTNTQTWEEPLYYDVDDDMHVESYSSSANIYGYTHHSRDYQSHKAFDIPFKLLLQSKENMEKSVIALADKHKEAEAEKERLKKIQQLEEELSRLKKS